MKTLNNYFDKIYCINLDRRTDRWKECVLEFNKHQLDVERFSAIDGKNDPEIIKKVDKSYNLVYGDVGCARSHRLIIDKSNKNNFESILILEDDVEFHENLNDLFFDMINQVPDDWDILFLGSNYSLNNHWQKEPVEKITDNVYKLVFGYAIHAYALRKKCYDKVIECFLPENDKGDVLFSYAQKQLNTYVLRPHLAWQRPSYSDILEKNVNYQFLKK